MRVLTVIVVSIEKGRRIEFRDAQARTVVVIPALADRDSIEYFQHEAEAPSGSTPTYHTEKGGWAKIIEQCTVEVGA